MFNTFGSEAFTAPLEKLAELNQSVFTKMVEEQTKVVNDMVELTSTRVKAMTQVKDANGLNAFVKEQNELAINAYEQAVSGSKDAAEEVKAYNDEVVKIISESVKG